jgi:hypothetical protein
MLLDELGAPSTEEAAALVAGAASGASGEPAGVWLQEFGPGGITLLSQVWAGW